MKQFNKLNVPTVIENSEAKYLSQEQNCIGAFKVLDSCRNFACESCIFFPANKESFDMIIKGVMYND